MTRDASAALESVSAALKTCDWSAGRLLHSLIKNGKTAQMLGEGARLFYICKNGEMRAFLTLSRQDCINDPSLPLWIGFVYTYPAYRNRGYAGRLLNHAVAKAAESGADRVYLATNEIGFYERYGFEYAEPRLDVYGNMSRIYFRDCASATTSGDSDIVCLPI